MNEPTIVVLAVAVAVHVAIVRPWMLAWGATKAERGAPLPGVDLEPSASYLTTRAVSIDAPPERISDSRPVPHGDLLVGARGRPPRVRGTTTKAVRPAAGGR